MPPQYQKVDAFALSESLKCPLAVTTNGFVTRDGRAIMGRGIAKQANDKYPDLPELLGELIWKYGNRVGIIKYNPVIISFPVKPNHGRGEADLKNVVSHLRNRFRVGDYIPGWACIASPVLIRNSCTELMCLIQNKDFNQVVLNFPGIGAGELREEDVKSILDQELDERVIVVQKELI